MSSDNIQIDSSDLVPSEDRLKDLVLGEIYAHFSLSAGIRALQIVLHSTLPAELRKKAINSYLYSWKVEIGPKMEEKKLIFSESNVGSLFAPEVVEKIFEDAVSEAENSIRKSLEESPL